ncbi:hypothetical protein [Roseivirga pacifica]|uniref:hypothetical protein n=1 Tax=Roseivirga pacifica TaxID=1267423 RepID=UPI002094869A|nr:hypothetical protein [Roseivirga pacifica]MCO6357512.1 hypothetical protein [Roseivirga pacifica]MCO6367723.1 hypothetical protein [Roseivirga pacifica]MCO6369745.1 hypothetical protein [Roseivirga pacifica]MCO6373599.1 hypothetical protein [Roseivirga pacifica]MCO6377096.1 hypothetical protein [Roseivirga pacifica]
MQLLNSVNSLLASFQSSVIRASANAVVVYWQLLTKGFITETSTGQHFKLISELSLTGDWSNLIIYQGNDKPTYRQMLDLLSEDELLLTNFQTVTKSLKQKLKGIHTFPLVFSSSLSVLTIAATWNMLADDYYNIIHWQTNEFSWQTLGALAHMVGFPLLSWKRYLLPKFITKIASYILSSYRTVKGWFS